MNAEWTYERLLEKVQGQKKKDEYFHSIIRQVEELYANLVANELELQKTNDVPILFGMIIAT